MRRPASARRGPPGSAPRISPSSHCSCLSGLTQHRGLWTHAGEPSCHRGDRQAAGRRRGLSSGAWPSSSPSTPFAGGFVVQSLIAFWFYTRFGLGLEALGWIFFGADPLGPSLLLAGPRGADTRAREHHGVLY